MNLLEKDGIETRPFFIPLHTLPPFREESRLRKEYLPTTDKLSATGVNLPTFTSMTEQEIEFISSTIQNYQK